MDPAMDFFFRLYDDLIDNHFGIRKRLIRTNGRHVIEGVNKKRHIYTVEYNENSLVVMIRRRTWLFCNKIIATIKIDVENDSAIQAALKNIKDILLK